MHQDYSCQKMVLKAYLCPQYLLILKSLMHLVFVYIIGVSLLFFLRMLFLLMFKSPLNVFSLEVFTTFGKGFMFDNLVMSYILLLPVCLHFLGTVFKLPKQPLVKIQSLFLAILLPIVLIIGLSDLFYFFYFKTRINEASFQWLDEPIIVLKIIASNVTYLIILSVTFGLAFLLCRFLYKFIARQHDKGKPSSYGKNVLTYGVFIILCIFGIRGHATHPLRANDAAHCEDPILNVAGLNPPFLLFKSYTNSIRHMTDNTAMKYTKNYLGLKESKYTSPIARKINNNGNAEKDYNIVLILMESMSADYVGVFGNKDGLTPFLDSLAYASNSTFYTQAYSSGIHTNNGIFSSLNGLPSLSRIRPMSTKPLQKYVGLPYQLKQKGYRNQFYLTSDKSFDNVGNFVSYNYFDDLYSIDQFPKDKIVGPFGVADDYMYEYAVEKMDSLKGKFFTTLLSISNHEPFIFPDYFKCTKDDKMKCGVAYADWALAQFFNKAKKSAWYKNTIFVFVADHGREVKKSPFEIELSFNHIPLIIHTPFGDGSNKFVDKFIQQIDIYPTLMGMLNASYINNSLGQDIYKNPRPYAYFATDDKIGCIDKEWLYIYRYQGNETLHKLNDTKSKDYSTIEREKFESMRNYALAQTQTAEWMIKNKMVGEQAIKKK